jgi:DNA-binding NarL/FixJ family response regulator
MPVNRLRILIVDDNEPVRSGVRSLLDPSECTVCGEASDGMEAIEKARSIRPDLIIMDVSMPRMDGVEATRVIRTEIPGTEVIIISQNDPTVVARQAAEVRAFGAVSKSELAEALLPMIHMMMERKQPAI